MDLRPTRSRLLPVLLPALLLAAAPALGLQEGSVDPAAAPLREGRTALEEGRPADAARHLRAALVHRPADAEILGLLLEAGAGDADARILWAHAWWAAAADADGKATPSGDLRKLFPQDDAALSRLATSRAQAVAELLRFANARAKKGRKDASEMLVAWWARRLAAEIAGGAPALEEAYAQELDLRLVAPPNAHGPVVDALKKLMNAALAGRDVETAMRAARCLRGLAVQAGFEDLQGERPRGMDKVGKAAADGLARARDLQRRQVGEPWTIEELEEFTPEEAEAFTREHSSFANPGVALSPRGRYRVETDCGYGTLLGVARTIELHHERLAGWYGEDPFGSVQGTVRIVPEAHGLEAEGVPFWWAGGMQGGNVTTMRFSCGTIEGLGHGLTHELTHRFDGALYAGQMAWLTEGKAVWTGAAFGHSSDEGFVENHASFGTIEGAWIKGYGGLDKLTELLEGEIEDYRDNYVAGYALYVYLATWEEDGRRLFGDRLRPYMKGSFKGNRRPKAWFEQHFCDGEDGRPESLEAFAQGFDRFMGGFYWQDRKPFTNRYTQDTPAGPGDGWVYDEPTWTWSRKRAEPYFGGDQARVAAELLADAGKTRDAAQAYVWALAVDGRTPAAEIRLAGLLRELRRADAAWVLEQGLGGPERPATERAPFLGSLPRLRAHLENLAETAASYSDGGHAIAGAALAAAHDRIAAATGAELLAAAAPAGIGALHPYDPPARHAGTRGWEEDGLTDYEEHRAPGLWYADAHGDLHVGRRKPREGTGRMDRRAHQRHAFARSTEWQLPGTYRIRTRIQLTTSFVNGALILGYTRRDQNVRLQFNAGDFLYAIGVKEEEPKLESVSWRLHGLRDRDYALPGAVPGGTVEFPDPVPTFDLELLVDGGGVHAFVNGDLVGSYHTVDGAPIEGYVGFASSFGAFRAQRPVIERLDASRLSGRAEAGPPGLTFERVGTSPFEDLVNNVCRGVAASTTGTILLWIAAPDREPGEELDSEAIVRRATRATEGFAELLALEYATQPLVLVVPAALGDEGLATLRKKLASMEVAIPPILLHPGTGLVPEGADDTPDRGKRWVVFLDPAGVVRVLAPFISFRQELPSRLEHWMTVFRDHGRPERELPPVPERGADEEPASGE